MIEIKAVFLVSQYIVYCNSFINQLKL